MLHVKKIISIFHVSFNVYKKFGKKIFGFFYYLLFFNWFY